MSQSKSSLLAALLYTSVIQCRGTTISISERWKVVGISLKISEILRQKGISGGETSLSQRSLLSISVASYDITKYLLIKLENLTLSMWSVGCKRRNKLSMTGSSPLVILQSANSTSGGSCVSKGNPLAFGIKAMWRIRRRDGKVIVEVGNPAE